MIIYYCIILTETIKVMNSIDGQLICFNFKFVNHPGILFDPNLCDNHERFLNSEFVESYIQDSYELSLFMRNRERWETSWDEVPSKEQAIDYFGKQVAFFETTFNNIKKEKLFASGPTILYRGVTTDRYKVIDDIIIDPGIISTSWDPNIALEFTSKSNDAIVLKYLLPPNSPMFALKSSTMEKEVLLPANSSFKILSRKIVTYKNILNNDIFYTATIVTLQPC